MLDPKAVDGPADTVIPDIQSKVSDVPALDISEVGIKGVRYPIRWVEPIGERCTVANFDLYVHLEGEKRGAHMSRFVGLLEKYLAKGQPALDLQRLSAVHRDMLSSLEAPAGKVKLSMPWFIEKEAPVSRVSGLMDYEVRLVVEGSASAPTLQLTVVVPVTSLCPCSKGISEYGAHNQRSYVSLMVETNESVSFAELISLVEAQGSCELYSLLKRIDEKYVTEYAYRNPKFVEDLVRYTAWAVRGDARFRRFCVEGENIESIHNHSVFARIEG